MKLILFSGSHPRHLFINKRVLDFFDDVLVIVMQREEVLPEPPSNLNQLDKKLFIKHFANRYEVEKNTYGNLSSKEVFKGYKTIYIDQNELNTERIAKEVEIFSPDIAFIFGVDLILDPVLDKLPVDKINLHLGLSPWYKGGATLYFPFYHLRPQYCGCTFHKITKDADAGEIIHQCVPKLEYGDKIHDVGAKCVLKAREDLTPIFEYWKENKSFRGKKQNIMGKNWLASDFHASQLRVIYKLFNDDIVDRYLNKDLEQKKPRLFSCIDK